MSAAPRAARRGGREAGRGLCVCIVCVCHGVCVHAERSKCAAYGSACVGLHIHFCWLRVKFPLDWKSGILRAKFPEFPLSPPLQTPKFPEFPQFPHLPRPSNFQKEFLEMYVKANQGGSKPFSAAPNHPLGRHNTPPAIVLPLWPSRLSHKIRRTFFDG